MNACVRFVAGNMSREQLTDSEIDDIVSLIEHYGILVSNAHIPSWGKVFCIGKIHPVLLVLEHEQSDDWLSDNYETLLTTLQSSAIVHDCRIKKWLNDIDSNFSDIELQ